MSKTKKALAIGGGVLVMLLVIGLVLPSSWEVTRETQINAPPEQVYLYIADFKNGWTQWSPFGPKMDPEVRLSFSGPEQGVGATQSFTGGQLGEGTMRITEADPAAGVTYELEGGPVRIIGRIALSASAGGTRVRWTDNGDFGGNNPLMNYAALMAGGMSGEPMERGLADLKLKAEAKR